MKERVRRLEQEAQQWEQQQSQIAMGHDTGRYGLHDELVQPQETQQEEQQQTQMTTGQGTNALEFLSPPPKDCHLVYRRPLLCILKMVNRSQVPTMERN